MNMKDKTMEISNVLKNTHRVLRANETGEFGNFSHNWSYRPIGWTLALNGNGFEGCDDFAEPNEGLS